MRDPAEIKRIARERIGRTALTLGAECTILARLLDEDEPIEAMALGRLRGAGPVGSQRLIVATPRRIVLTEKGFFSRREKTREIPRDAIREIVVTPPGRVDLVLGDERVELSLVLPPRQLAALAGGSRSAELLDLARERLGRLFGTASQDHVVALVAELEPDEEVLDLAYAAETKTLVAVTPSRVVLLTAGAVRIREPISLPYDELGSAALEDEVLVVEPRVGEAHRVGPLSPQGAAAVLAAEIWSRGGL